MKKNENEAKSEKVSPAANQSSQQVEMTDDQMSIYLADLANSIQYQALLRLMRIKDYQAIGAMATIDPFKNPTEMARNQGVRMGIYYVESEIKKAKEKHPREDK